MRLFLLCTCSVVIKFGLALFDFEIDFCINNGFKNFVFNTSNSEIVLRASLVTEGNQVKSFRTPALMIDFQSLIVNALIQIKDNRSKEHYILDKMLQCLQLDKMKDIVPVRDLQNEYILQAKANTFSKLFLGTAGSVQRQLIKLPIYIENNTIYLAIDIQIRLEGSLNALEKEMTEFDLYFLLYAYFSFKKHAGVFHVDAHPGNILYDSFNEEIYFVWADFGATSSRSDPENQFRNSLISFHNKIFQKARKYLPVQNLLLELVQTTFEYNKSYIMEIDNIERIKSAISSSILLRFKGDEEGMKSALKKLSPALGFGFDFLFAENVERKQEYLELQNANKTKSAEILELRSEILELQDANKTKSAEILELQDANKTKSAEILELRSDMNKLSKRMRLLEDTFLHIIQEKYPN